MIIMKQMLVCCKKYLSLISRLKTLFLLFSWFITVSYFTFYLIDSPIVNPQLVWNLNLSNQGCRIFEARAISAYQKYLQAKLLP